MAVSEMSAPENSSCGIITSGTAAVACPAVRTIAEMSSPSITPTQLAPISTGSAAR